MRGAGLCSPLPCGLPVGVTAAVPMSSAHLGVPPGVGAMVPSQGSPRPPISRAKHGFCPHGQAFTVGESSLGTGSGLVLVCGVHCPV